MLDIAEYRRWMSQALKTLELVEADIVFEGYSWACFKAQQAAEYALKAILYLFGEPAFGHDLIGLAKKAERVCGPIPGDVWDCIYMLDKMYIPPRSPDAFPEGAPGNTIVGGRLWRRRSMHQRSSSGLEGAPPGLASRARRLREVLETLCSWAKETQRKLGRATILVFGSYARGDFNLWSDIDVIVVSGAFEGVPFTRRWRLLPQASLPVEAITWTPRETERMLSKSSWRKALEDCLALLDDYRLAPRTCRETCSSPATTSAG